jgi:hypothetical protein
MAETVAELLLLLVMAAVLLLLLLVLLLLTMLLLLLRLRTILLGLTAVMVRYTVQKLVM